MFGKTLKPPKSHACELLGSFALAVQAFMGLLALSSLLYKRHKEHPPRPWKVWLFDVSKQAFGAAGLHVLNVGLSILFSGSNQPAYDSNPCNWYFLNVLLDTTLGIPVLWFFLYLWHTAAIKVGMTQTISGDYGNPPSFIAFLKQAVIYFIAMVSMKVIMYAFCLWTPFLDDLGNLLISWTNFNEMLQVTFVMMIFPLIMNTLQYYLIDTIIKAPLTKTRQESYGAIKNNSHLRGA